MLPTGEEEEDVTPRKGKCAVPQTASAANDAPKANGSSGSGPKDSNVLDGVAAAALLVVVVLVVVVVVVAAAVVVVVVEKRRVGAVEAAAAAAQLPGAAELRQAAERRPKP